MGVKFTYTNNHYLKWRSKHSRCRFKARCRKQGNSLARWVAVVTHLNEVLDVLDHFLEVVQCADSAPLDDGTYESLPEPSAVGAAPAEGLRTLVALGMLREKVLKPVPRNRATTTRSLTIITTFARKCGACSKR